MNDRYRSLGFFDAQTASVIDSGEAEESTGAVRRTYAIDLFVKAKVFLNEE
jgi:hypothetical protein